MARLYSPVSSSVGNEGLAQAIGDMIFAWVRAEDAISITLSAMLDIDIETSSQLMASSANFRARVGMAKAVASQNECYLEIGKILDKISSKSGARNDYVHDVYAKSTTTDDIILVKRSAKIGTPKRWVATKAHDIKTHADSVRKLADELLEECQRVMREEFDKAWLGPSL